MIRPGRGGAGVAELILGAHLQSTPRPADSTGVAGVASLWEDCLRRNGSACSNDRGS